MLNVLSYTIINESKHRPLVPTHHDGSNAKIFTSIHNLNDSYRISDVWTTKRNSVFLVIDILGAYTFIITGICFRIMVSSIASVTGLNIYKNIKYIKDYRVVSCNMDLI